MQMFSDFNASPFFSRAYLSLQLYIKMYFAVCTEVQKCFDNVHLSVSMSA